MTTPQAQALTDLADIIEANRERIGYVKGSLLDDKVKQARALATQAEAPAAPVQADGLCWVNPAPHAAPAMVTNTRTVQVSFALAATPPQPESSVQGASPSQGLGASASPTGPLAVPAEPCGLGASPSVPGACGRSGG